ncbi:hypothetical protein GWI33_018387 [Rhynchophorus ferrugineus]|uniref:DUF4757 domain-containing protein n=1 Tax=Rhynchophorus ferrugineus TaxID=354439 RepID=A0A834HV14_RHYFE|nr:hypothetical protein GWI33_018387 [Rhynchophorus ferrugineus]
MENHDHDKDSHEKRNLNTEYLPTKCRITRPPPPKPASNPLQFVKVAPCPLFQKAHEQIKKVEEIKKERKEIRDETEDWQQNLDNWKSSRRKRQEHIIERVVEVKKLTEQEELDKSRRKSKTFSEMLEERNQKGRPKFTIPIYNDDDANDLSDYGIGSSSSKANSVKDADTDDSNSVLDEKDHRNFDLAPSKDLLTSSNTSHSEDEVIKEQNNKIASYLNNNISPSTNKHLLTKQKPVVPPKTITSLDNKYTESNANKESVEQYTYEGAIQDYRSRIKSKIKVDESIFTRNKDITKSKEFSEAQTVLPKGEISKRKGLFESSKSIDIGHADTITSRRLSEDFANARSIKDRLKSLENFSDQSQTKIDKNEIQVSVKQRLANFNKSNDIDNNIEKPKPNKISNYLLDKSSSVPVMESRKTTPSWKNERCSSPETEMYMNKLNMFNRDLDNLMGAKSVEDNLEDYCSSNSNYPPSTSSVELTGVLSDREDSGIHTADVSCSVSQADEPIDTDSDTIPNCIEKLKKSEELNLRNQIINEETCVDLQTVDVGEHIEFTREEVIDATKTFLDELIKDATDNISTQLVIESNKNDVSEITEQTEEEHSLKQNKLNPPQLDPPKLPNLPQPPKTVIYENVELKPFNHDLALDFITADFTLSPSKLEPPKEKPPPPPPPDDCETPTRPIKRLNSTKRIKKEIHSKRSSFLGLDDSNIDFDLDQIIQKPPDINAFLQKEHKLEKSLYKKMQEETRSGLLSKVESQDSGLDIDRGRLSSDTWCSSTPSHDRQDSEHTNSITSEEDEITKKEREIIEMVEKEEKSRDKIDFIPNAKPLEREEVIHFEPTLGSEQFNSPYFPQTSSHYLEDQDSEVLKVEHELRQLEREELERQRENMLFRESRARLQSNRHSLENICDDIYNPYTKSDYRKSMPELQKIPVEFRKSISDVPSAYYENTEQYQYRQSMPDIQHAYQSTGFASNNLLAIDHRKSMPELQHETIRSAFISPTPMSRSNVAKQSRTIQAPKPRILTKPNIKALSAVPRNRHSDNWITPKANPETKNYNQHWVFQEAELRRISDQQQKTAVINRTNWQQQRQEKPLPDSVIQTITQRVQNRTSLTERNQPIRRSDVTANKEFNHHPTYVNHVPSVPFSQPVGGDDSLQDRMLSVSGKKKCSFCNNELGRGAAMIIESLCLFYHMDDDGVKFSCV